jgi:hypothetical protein
MPALLPSELPVLARARLHWVVLLRRPHPLLLIALLVLLVAAVVGPAQMTWAFLAVLGGFAYVRFRGWAAETVLLTRRRVIRVQGIPETTTTEASLRLDRISGAVLVQTVWGKLLDYGTIELEAPGQHPDVRRLDKIARPRRFYLTLRQVLFDEPPPPLDPSRGGGTSMPDVPTAPLPRIGPPALPPWGARHRR